MNIAKKLAFLAVLVANSVYASPDNYELTQVLIVSRHGLRAPLTDGSNLLTNATPYKWPHWDTDAGLLTTKGGALEVFMGSYFKQWFVETGLVTKNSCVDDSLFVYTNTMPRTIATGQFFMDGAFPGCRVNIKTQQNKQDHDPLFYQSVKNKSASFVTDNTKAILGFINDSRLDPSYKKLEQIIDYKNSPDCKERRKCQLSDEVNVVNLDLGKEPSIEGPLNKSFLIVDAFILQDYEGFPEKDVAWGKIQSDSEWKLLARLRNSYIEAAYLQPAVADNIISPLLSKVSELLPGKMNDGDNKINVIVGHDTTVGPLIAAMGFNQYELPGQYEKTPIGGKLVFQRWTDKTTKKDYLKTEYVYQTTTQMRNLTPLSIQTPPKRVTLSFKGCTVDNNGYCSWDDFRTVIESLVR